MIDIITRKKMSTAGTEQQLVESGFVDSEKNLIVTKPFFPSSAFGFSGDDDIDAAVLKEEDLLAFKDNADLIAFASRNSLTGVQVVSLSSGRNHAVQLLALRDLEQTVSKVKNGDTLVVTCVNEDNHYLIFTSKISNPKMDFAISIDDMIASVQFTFDAGDLEVKSGILASNPVH